MLTEVSSILAGIRYGLKKGTSDRTLTHVGVGVVEAGERCEVAGDREEDQRTDRLLDVLDAADHRSGCRVESGVEQEAEQEEGG